MYNTTIIAGFPGVGKSKIAQTSDHGPILDLEPYPFQYGPGNESWPRNYLDAIFESMGTYRTVLIASYPEVIKTLTGSGNNVIVVYPDESQRDEYVTRYKRRGNKPEIVQKLGDMYEQNVRNLQALDDCRHVVLKPGQYLSDVFPSIGH